MQSCSNMYHVLPLKAIFIIFVANYYIKGTLAGTSNEAPVGQISPQLTEENLIKQGNNRTFDPFTGIEGNGTLDQNVSTEIPIQVQLRKTFLFQFAWVGIHYSYLPVIVIVGLFGNIITLIVMLQKKNRGLTCCLYMANLAVSDTGVLLYGAFTWFDTMFQLIPKTDLSCGTANLVLGVISNYNVMILVAMTVDRYLAIRYPLKVHQLCTIGRVKLVMVILALFSTALTLPVLFTAKSPDGRTCAAHASGTILDQIHSVLTLIVFSLAPFFSILFMNIAIIRMIRNRHKNLSKYRSPLSTGSKTHSFNTLSAATSSSAISEPSTSSASDVHGGSSGKISGLASKQDIQLTVMLVTVSFVFLLMILPLYIRYIIGSAVDYKKDLDTFAAYFFIMIFSAKTHITNSGINFFLYCLSGSRFRADVINLLCCGKQNGNRKLCQTRHSTEVVVQTVTSVTSESSASMSQLQ